jgi:hypothetical protein
MKNIRRELFRYADLICHLWNAYFSDLFTGLDEHEPLCSFDEIENKLFVTLVCRPLGIQLADDYFWGQRKNVKEIVVVPSSGGEISIMFREPNTGLSQNWNESEVIDASRMSCSFMEFFQWDRFGYLNMTFVRCTVTDWPEHPEFVGREALLKTENVDFFLANSGEAEEKPND